MPETYCDYCYEPVAVGVTTCRPCQLNHEARLLVRKASTLAVMADVLLLLRDGKPRGRRAICEAMGGNRVQCWDAVTRLADAGDLIEGDRFNGHPRYVVPLIMDWSFGSPVEEQFWRAFAETARIGFDNDVATQLRGLIPQCPVGRYRIDFGIPDAKFGIEIDGLAYHNGQESFMKDRKRQRELEAEGWRIVRFAAKEVMEDARACVLEAAEQAVRVGVTA